MMRKEGMIEPERLKTESKQGQEKDESIQGRRIKKKGRQD